MNPDQELLIERACQRLVIDSASLNDTRDWAALAALYAADARLERPSGQVVEGREAIEAAYRGGPVERRSRHLCTNIRVEIDGPSSARATTMVLLYAWELPSSGSGDNDALPAVPPPSLGEFEDRFALTDEGWRISSRTARILARPRI